MLITSTTLISCNFSSLPLKNLNSRTSSQNPNPKPLYLTTSISPLSLKYCDLRSKITQFSRKGHLQICQNSIKTQNSQDPVLDKETELSNNGSGGGDEQGRDWTTSFLLFLLWGGLMYYVFNLAPNQTPSTDMYLLKKLLNLTGDDGFQMNAVIVSLWYIMGLWPLIYSMLLLPTGRSSKGNVPVGPFLILSCFGGAYALLPYFVLWRPPSPPIEETELKRWPLNFLESKFTAGITIAAGLGIIIYAGLANGDVWKEFFQYFGGSKFVRQGLLASSLIIGSIFGSCFIRSPEAINISISKPCYTELKCIRRKMMSFLSLQSCIWHPFILARSKSQILRVPMVANANDSHTYTRMESL